MKVDGKLIFAAVIFIGLIGSFGAKTLLIKAVAREVIPMLRQEYVPGPFTPGFDPDKVDPRTFQQSPQQLPQQQPPHQHQPQQVPYLEPNGFPEGLRHPNDYNQQWLQNFENQRL